MISELLANLIQLQQRALLRVSGEQEKVTARLKLELQQLQNKHIVWFGEANNENLTQAQYTDIRIKQYRRYLGQEADIVVIDCYAGFNPDALGALAGIVKLGGICVLITPEDQEWLTYTDPEVSRICVYPYEVEQISHYFIKHLLTSFEQSDTIIDWNIHQSFPDVCLPNTEGDGVSQAFFPAKNKAQWELVEDICSLRNANSKAIITQADRGRGKSAALALAVIRILQQRPTTKLLICSPVQDSLLTFWAHIQQGFPELNVQSNVGNNLSTTAGGFIKYVAPDVLTLQKPECDILMVDEAAAIPFSILSPAIEHYDKIVFSTTVHGYEGTGRGFEFKLKPLIEKSFSEVVHHNLSQPIRWRLNDALENDVNNLLLTSIDLPSFIDVDVKELQFVSWHSQQLVDNKQLLEQLFALLVFAHYRTSPQDLRNLLDGPNMKIVGAVHEGKLVAACLVAMEGNIKPNLVEDIWRGNRRPRGHLIPQSLVAHAGFKNMAKYTYGRVVRIAVHPSLQGQGIGTWLIDKTKHFLRQLQCDFIATSFGLSEDLIRFWQKCGLVIVRLGLKAEASTGEYSAMMLQAISHDSGEEQPKLQHRFEQTLAVEKLLGKRQELPYIKVSVDLDLKLTEQDDLDLTVLANHHRTPDTCLLPMYKLLKLRESYTEFPLLYDKFVQGLSNLVLIEKYSLAGTKQLTNEIRAQVKQLF